MSALAPIGVQQKSVGFKHVLVATDFSAVSERALVYALAIVRRYHSTLTIVHAVPPETREAVTWDPLPRELDSELLEAEQAMGILSKDTSINNLDPHLLVERGRIWDVLLSIILREKIDLLVLGTHGRGGLKKLTLGSVAEEVLHQATCPVLTIGPNVPPTNHQQTGFGSILFATDFGPASFRAFSFALSLAEESQAKLVLLHMLPFLPVDIIGRGDAFPGMYADQGLTEWQNAMKKESIERLKKLVPADTKLNRQPEYSVGIDFLPEGILGAAATHHAELIVMGANRVASARMSSHIPWAVTHTVICEANCPVLTVMG